jgi:hypothetical protein
VDGSLRPENQINAIQWDTYLSLILFNGGSQGFGVDPPEEDPAIHPLVINHHLYDRKPFSHRADDRAILCVDCEDGY